LCATAISILPARRMAFPLRYNTVCAYTIHHMQAHLCSMLTHYTPYAVCSHTIHHTPRRRQASPRSRLRVRHRGLVSA
jgi:hypothetical protein